MIRRVKPHIPRTLRCLKRLNHAILIRRILMNNRKRAIRVGSERISRCRVVARAIDARADARYCSTTCRVRAHRRRTGTRQ